MAAVLPSSVAPGKGASSRQADTAQRAELEAGLVRLKTSLSTYLKPAEIERVEAAFAFGDAAHIGQFRVSGAPYVSHPLAVAEKLAAWHLDAQAIIAALLHDVMEDTAITKQEIVDRFGNAAAELVDGVSKLDRIEDQSYEEAQAENFRKMLLAMARDVRVILIKLSDRLHNMQTLGAIRPDKRRRIARETLDIYAPIANRLGLNTLYRELQELSFQHLYPLRYRVLAKAVKSARGNRREVVEKILQAVKKRLPEAGIEAEVMGREKHLYGIYRKMREKHLTFSQVLDIYGFRIIVKDVPTCYLTLGVLHGLYNPVPGKFKDYIAIPKANGYQSLHTTLIGPFSTPVEAQIRTAAMHHVAESGVASHWLYKDDKALSDLQKKTSLWLQSLLELQSASGDSTEFLEHVKIDLFSGEVYVFTPAGKILVLPRGSTPVDFAYAVHTDIGNHCVACRINNELMPLRTELHNGDRVEIITAPHANPNPAWLGYVKSARSRSNIRHFLKTQQQELSAALGERLLSQAFRNIGAVLADITPARWKHLLHETGSKSKHELLTDIGLGTRLAAIVARRFSGGVNKELGKVKTAERKSSGPILIRGTEGLAVQLASCCRPIPGDPVIGLIRKGQGLMVHTHDCANIARQRGDRVDWVDVEWEPDVDGLFDVGISVLVQNQRGVLAKLTTAIAEGQSNIVDVSVEGDHGTTASVYFTLQVLNRAHLARVLRGLRQIPEAIRIVRLKDREINHHHH
ncbi:bifunctional (p)ppGpp synthetase II and guanosine-3',5'-bis pyrophosphate 3'-pyrophosphohydrolase [Georgfuchsia toluolica]|uniref:Bifunctional (P)ppGpp synthetase II and guanosine-3',5'-bis pyrophosphate 3'-pyrophosphohydrolase n=1 Tax=Georgfuchsia toluolica TaxID=424218 RepID=A0A916J6J4_9PROT|nr:bifunctional (p)ppGpp synthetase/guanosine-3',5'-bis(diphosphate) 3'-pyrophosphohydrolase [Georgfuchsia toluolica]CAG4884869.1 bifunctional (p)ppGpp synthetase II and guanosine-3',5'-bis pyrophosphate 3'-pyrophosphohydrolase [Georgfuchsia toluolica]